MTSAFPLPTVEEYRKMLKRHDWEFEFCDEGRKYRSGNAERRALDAAQPVIDADCAIWNEFAPADHKRQQVTA